jgi:DNA primase
MKKNYPFVVVCEGQIDALTCWSYGVPAVALFGVGSSEQYKVLNSTGIRNWVTFFDNDDAGRKATNRFNKMIRKDTLVTNLSFGNINKKDINDLTIQEFDQILDDQGLYFRINR